MSNDKFARWAIYGLSGLMVFACCFFWIGARGYAAENALAESAPAADTTGTAEPVAELTGPALATRQAAGLPVLPTTPLPAPSQPAPPDSSQSPAPPDSEAASRVLAESQPSGGTQAGLQTPQSSAPTPDAGDPAAGQPDPDPGPDSAAAEPAGPTIDEATLVAELERMAGLGFDLGAVTPEYKGSFHATAYCAEAYPHICGGNGITASGTVPTPGLTAAADWSVLPAGTWLYIEGVGIRRVEDSGSAIKKNRLDVNVDTHANALVWPGFGSHEVWVLG